MKVEEAQLIGTSIEDAARRLNQLIGHAVTRGLIVVAKTVDVRFMGPQPTPFVDVEVRVQIADLEDAPSAEGPAEAMQVAEAGPVGIPANDVTKAGPLKAQGSAATKKPGNPSRRRR